MHSRRCRTAGSCRSRSKAGTETRGFDSKTTGLDSETTSSSVYSSHLVRLSRTEQGWDFPSFTKSSTHTTGLSPCGLARAQEPPSSLISKMPKRAKILVVDDERSIRE